MQQRTAATIAFSRLLCHLVTDYQERTILEMFDLDNYIETQRFSMLHQIVLGLRKTPLMPELERSTAELNVRATDGQTPLWWAASRGDTEKVKMLLKYGADPNISDRRKCTPLMQAAQCGCWESCERLLQGGADIASRDSLGRTALHYTFNDPQAPSSSSLVAMLLAQGADIEAVDQYGVTPIFCAMQAGRPSTTAELVRCGANLAHRNLDGETPLMLAIIENIQASVQLLLERGADYTLKDNNNWTILHLAAKFADVKTLRVLSNAKLGRLNVGDEDVSGWTPEDVFLDDHENDSDYSPLATAFQDLLESIDNAKACAEEPDDAPAAGKKELERVQYAMPGDWPEEND